MFTISIVLRLAQLVCAAFGLYTVLMAGTFLLQYQQELAINFGVVSLVTWIIWSVISMIVSRRNQEIIREVALIVYPGGALLSLALGVYCGYWMEGLLTYPDRQMWTIILASVMFALVMIIRCLDIPWMRTRQDVEALEKVAEHDQQDKS